MNTIARIYPDTDVSTNNRLFQLFGHLSKFLLVGYMLLWSNSSQAAGPAQLKISTDIAPIHSLVSMVVQEHGSVELIIPSNQSPHDFTLKPSQIRSINQSDLVVVVSESFTPSLSRNIKTLNPDIIVLDLSGSDSHESEEEKTDNKEHQDDGHIDEHLLHDEHTWLNPLNAISWLEHIAEAAASLDETNRANYQQNANNAIAKLSQLNFTLSDKLANVRDVQYIVYHDAYQHFAHAFDLSNPIAIALSDARAPGAAKIRQIRSAAQQSRCVFAEVQHEDAIVQTVSSGLPVNRGILDPLGSTIATGPELYSELMNGLAQSFLDCLSE